MCVAVEVSRRLAAERTTTKMQFHWILLLLAILIVHIDLSAGEPKRSVFASRNRSKTKTNINVRRRAHLSDPPKPHQPPPNLKQTHSPGANAGTAAFSARDDSREGNVAWNGATNVHQPHYRFVQTTNTWAAGPHPGSYGILITYGGFITQVNRWVQLTKYKIKPINRFDIFYVTYNLYVT